MCNYRYNFRRTILLKIDTTHKRCFKCKYFSRDTRDLVYRKKFRFLRMKYWFFLLSKLNIWDIGRCQITIIDKRGQHINTFMHGYEKCIFKDVENDITDARDFIGKIPDDPTKMEAAIRKVENKEND